jgi:hypothetical protein
MVKCGYEYPKGKTCYFEAEVGDCTTATIVHLESEENEGYSIIVHIVTDRSNGVMSTQYDSIHGSYSMVRNCSKCDKVGETKKTFDGRWLCRECWDRESKGPFP